MTAPSPQVLADGTIAELLRQNRELLLALQERDRQREAEFRARSANAPSTASPAVPEQLPPPGQVFHQGQLTAPAPIQFVINMPENGARRGRSPPRDFDPDLFQLLRSAMRRRDF